MWGWVPTVYDGELQVTAASDTFWGSNNFYLGVLVRGCPTTYADIVL